DLVGVVDQRARADAEHRPPARHVVELRHARGQRERMVVRQRHHAGAEPDVARALGRGGQKHLRTGDDLEAAGVMLAHPGFVIVQPVEMLDQLHVAVDRQRRVLAQRMEGREEDSGAEVAVLYRYWHGALPQRVCRGTAYLILRSGRRPRLEGWATEIVG